MTEPAAPIAALIFDMDGLLVDSEPLAERALVACLARYDRVMRPETMERSLGKRLPEAIAAIAAAYDLPGAVPSLVEEYGRMRLAALRGNVRPMPGARELLRFGRQARLGLALATSSHRAHADLSLAETGLAGLFDAEATGDEVTRGKPAPDLFLLASARLGVDPDRAVVLEDAPAGLSAAEAAGMRAIWVPNASTRGLVPTAAPTATLPDLFAVVDWLAERGVAQATDR